MSKGNFGGQHNAGDFRVVYLVGMMRSGSTLVGEYLGSFPDTAVVGELVNTWRSTARGQGCSCGKPPDECEVWSHVLDGAAADRVAELDAIRSKVDRQRWLPLLMALAKVPERRWPRFVRDYVDQLRTQAATLARVHGARTLIDTSKSPAGLALACLAFPGRVTALQVIRDPRAVAHSQSRHTFTTSAISQDVPAQQSASRSAKLWATSNFEGSLVSLMATRRARLSYEQLGTDPRDVLEEVARELGLQGPAPSWQGNEVTLRRNHVLAGNPSRAEGAVRRVEVSDSWRGELTEAELRSVRLHTSPVRLWLRLSEAGARRR